MFYVVKKSRIILALILVLTVSVALFLSVVTRDKNISLCTNHLKSLGYSPEKKPENIAEITIPEGFGSVYENYNALQAEAGYDLTPLRGKTVYVYTFNLKDDEFTLANIMISDGEIRGGDIMNPSLSGKMIPLIPKK